MILKKLEIAGFKSFGKPVMLEFDAPVTAIVGPNGSGKSNVSEAIRRVGACCQRVGMIVVFSSGYDILYTWLK